MPSSTWRLGTCLEARAVPSWQQEALAPPRRAAPLVRFRCTVSRLPPGSDSQAATRSYSQASGTGRCQCRRAASCRRGTGPVARATRLVRLARTPARRRTADRAPSTPNSWQGSRARTATRRELGTPEHRSMATASLDRPAATTSPGNAQCASLERRMATTCGLLETTWKQ